MEYDAATWNGRQQVKDRVSSDKHFTVSLSRSLYIQDVTGGTDQTSGECSLRQTIPI